MIKNLLSLGWTQRGIADEIGIGQSTIAEILAGRSRDMRWTNGDRLLRLYRRATKGKAGLKEKAAADNGSTAEAEHA